MGVANTKRISPKRMPVSAQFILRDDELRSIYDTLRMPTYKKLSEIPLRILGRGLRILIDLIFLQCSVTDEINYQTYNPSGTYR